VGQEHVEAGIKLGSWVNTCRQKRSELSAARVAVLDALGFVWHARDERFERKFRCFEQFVLREGHANVPQGHREDRVNIGSWVSYVRHHRDDLPAQRIAQLEALGFVWNPHDEQFQQHVKLLAHYRQREGHAAVPPRHAEEGVQLGRWVVKMRARRNQLSNERVEQLDALGFVWSPHADAFEAGVTALGNFIAREGHARVPQNHVEGSLNLGGWVATVRAAKASLPQQRTARLDALGFTWEARTERFEENILLLADFVRRTGHAKVPQDHVEQGIKLGVWVNTIRQSRPILSDERVEQLSSLRFVWNVQEDGLSRHLNALQAFVDREGHARVPPLHIEDSLRLGAWVIRVRMRRQALTADTVNRLNELGFVWDAREDHFERNVDALTRFIQREGHARVPVTHVEEGVQLGSWVAGLRANRNALTAARRDRLDALRFEWTPRVRMTSDSAPPKGLARDEIFERNMHLLRQFREREGHASVPKPHIEGGIALGKWVQGMRSRRQHLPEGRSIQLAEVGFVWGAHDDRFQQYVGLLQQFVSREGHARVPGRWTEGGHQLGAWVTKTRSRRAALSPDRIAQLDALGFVWSVRGKKLGPAPDDVPHDARAPDAAGATDERPGRDEPHDA
jgi:hypothetical protein